MTHILDGIHTPNFKPRVVGIVSVVAVIALIGVALVARFALSDHEREMKNWQDKLNLVADSRARDITVWVENNFTELKKVADNPSLQIYFTELNAEENGSMKRRLDADEPPQKVFLRNLLIFTADRMGFSPANVPLSVQQIPTQIPYSSNTGLAVLNTENKVVVSTPFLASTTEELAARLKEVPLSKQTLLDMQKDAQGKLQIGFMVPVFGIQADPENSEPVGRILGIKEVNDELYKLLQHPGITEKTMEVLLVRVDGDNITYLSPLKDEAAPLDKQLANKPSQLAEAFAVSNPGSFGEGRDYKSKDVLITGRAVPGTPWTLILKIDRKEALGGSDMRRNGMIAVFGAILLALIGVIVAVWYNASSRRALEASTHFRQLAHKSAAQEKLLKVVTENQPDAIYILDTEKRFRFANKRTAEVAQMNQEFILGKPVSDVMGSAKSETTVRVMEQVMDKNVPMSIVRRSKEDDGEEVVIRSEFVPLQQIPVPVMDHPIPGVLIVDQDISEVVHEREKRLRTHKQLIDTLIKLVDKRDPHASNHSALVSQVAHDIAIAMSLDHVTADTARIAGSLMNIGKIAVPEAVLVKTEKLNDDEKKSIRDSLQASIDLLQDIDFEGPVVQTLQQSQEFYDGSGPQGLKGDDILISARIIAVANAFVGMISPRAYRAAMAIDAAVAQLLEKVEAQYDRKVVVSLVNFIDNQGGRAIIEKSGMMKGAA